MFEGSIIDVTGIKVGNAQDFEAGTGCTVIICEDGAVSGIDVRGSAPGTRETDLLKPGNLIERIHAVVLSGGSAFGLAASDGVMRFLEEKDIGFDTGVAKVPIVASAVLFDLSYKSHSIRPENKMGYEACQNASNQDFKQGSIGAGTGATVGKILGMDYAMKGGLGTASISFKGVTVGAIAVVNAFGDIYDFRNAKIIAGAICPQSDGFLDTKASLLGGINVSPFSKAQNTTLAVVATDAKLNKEQACKIASMAHDGFARTINPVHTMFDGDTIFALSTGNKNCDITTIGVAATEVVARAVMNAVKYSRKL